LRGREVLGMSRSGIIGTSHRLNKAFTALALNTGSYLSTADLATQANIESVGATVRDLRLNGFRVECRRQQGKKIWEYRLFMNNGKAKYWKRKLSTLYRYFTFVRETKEIRRK
jgi:biotin operon repressor